MKKIILPLVVIAASGGYVFSQQGRINAENTIGGGAQTVDAQLAVPTVTAPGAAPALGSLAARPSRKPVAASVARVNLVTPALATRAAPAPEPALAPRPAPEPAAAVGPAPAVVAVSPPETPVSGAVSDTPVPMPPLRRAAPAGPQTAVAVATPTAAAQPGLYRDGTYKGATADAYYGLVQVQANIQNGQLASVTVLQYPNDRRTSRYINSQALPMLKHEAVVAQSAQVDFVSGATLTSGAYVKSLRNALSQAKT